MKFTALLTAGCALAIVLNATGTTKAQDASDQQFGRVHFETSCNDAAQRRFDRAMRYQHSFWYQQSKEVFEEAAQADPNCAIAYWGVALAYLNNPHNAIPEPNLAPGLAAVEKAKAIGAKTERERDYVDAIALMYKDYGTLTHTQRIRAYLAAMETLAAKYPKDDEAQIAYAITLNTSASSADKTYAQQLKGATILEAIWQRQPMHPGVAHYLIHLYDYPALASKGLEAAKKYAQIAPAAPHAQHMPSHIFTRVGFWKESIESNSDSAKSARVAKEWTDQLHAIDYVVYANLQLARDKEAQDIIDDMNRVTGFGPSAFAAHYALAASPARYRIERGECASAAQLEVRPNNFPHVMAVTHFARALGAARSGQPEAARADIAKLAELRDKLREAKNGYWAEQVDIQWQIANAWLLNAEGKKEEALAALNAAADLEDKTDKAPVTPGPLAPARELYGQMLLEHGKAKEALAAFAATQLKEPNRFNGFLGAAQAAAKLGDKETAKANYQKLLALTEGSNSNRNEIDLGRAYLKAN
jgi:Tfp pilus assembly protein PilF